MSDAIKKARELHDKVRALTGWATTATVDALDAEFSAALSEVEARLQKAEAERNAARAAMCTNEGLRSDYWRKVMEDARNEERDRALTELERLRAAVQLEQDRVQIIAGHRNDYRKEGQRSRAAMRHALERDHEHREGCEGCAEIQRALEWEEET